MERLKKKKQAPKVDEETKMSRKEFDKLYAQHRKERLLTQKQFEAEAKKKGEGKGFQIELSYKQWRRLKNLHEAGKITWAIAKGGARVLKNVASKSDANYIRNVGKGYNDTLAEKAPAKLKKGRSTNTSAETDEYYLRRVSGL